MQRWVYSYRTVFGDPERLEQLLCTRFDTLIEQAAGVEHTARAPDGGLRMRLNTTVAGLPSAKTVHLTTGVATHPEDRLKIPVQWHAEPGRHVFPVFEGCIELEPLSATSARLTLVGSYQPPAGMIGATADATLLRGVAERTVDQLIGALAFALSRMSGAAPGSPEPGPPAAALCVRDVMTAEPLVLAEDLPVRTAALLLFHFEVGGAPVADEAGGLVGVVSEADLLGKEVHPPHGLGRAAVAAERRWQAVTVGEICTRPALVTSPDAALHDAARLMQRRDVGRLVVVANARIVGILTRHDVLKALIRTDAALQETLDALLVERHEPKVVAGVEWGVVKLKGAVSKRSSLPGLVQAVRALDGVVAVDADQLGWVEDDGTPYQNLLT